MTSKLLLLLLCLPLLATAQDPTPKVNYSTLDKEGMKTSILLEEPSPFTILTQEVEEIGMFGFQQAYKDLAKADGLGRFPNLEKVNASMRVQTINETIKIGGIISSFETIDQEAVATGKISVDANGNLTKTSSDYIFDTYDQVFFSPLTTQKRGLNTSFYLDTDLFVNTSNKTITSIEIDFGAGSGFRSIPFNTPINVVYPTDGIKKIIFKIRFVSGEEVITKSKLSVSYSRLDHLQQRNAVQQDLIASIAPDLSIYPNTSDHAGLGEYEIFLGGDGILDKPLIVVDGFDPGDTRDITAVYNTLGYEDSNGTQQNLADKIRTEEDYDVIILNFPRYLILTDDSLLNLADVTDTNNDMIIDENDYPAGSTLVDGGVDFIERNALILVELINLINSQKIGCQQNVILGPSMGGLISRLGLTYMEQNGQDHDTRLWVSIDAPHYGANVPIGLQLLFNYFGYGYADSDSVKLLVDGMLRSPAARQMLVDHFDAHINPINSDTDDPVSPSPGLPYLPEGAPNYRNNFQNRLHTAGFPTQTRTISMANGSGLGAAFQDVNGNDVLPGFDLIDSNIDTGDVIIIINTRAVTFCEYMPSASVQEKLVDVKIQAQIIFWITQDTFVAHAETPSFTDGIDSAPGGLFDIFALADSLGGDPVLTNFLNAMNAGYFNFIPTTSSLGLANQPNYYALPNPNNGTTENESPFDAWYIPPTNEEHVELTDTNVAFVWNEIVLNTKANLAAKAMLQGPYSGSGLMTDNLRTDDLIPTTSPYPDGISCATSVFDTTGNDAIVDWVYLELRDPADSSIVVTTQSALIQRDGDIVDVDGVSNLSFPLEGGDFHVAIKHRNHLGIITVNPICLSHRSTGVDFSLDSTITLGGSNALFDFGDGSFGLLSGDATGNGQVQNDDLTTVVPLIGSAGYNSADMDLNGQVQNTDVTTFIGPNLGKASQF